MGISVGVSFSSVSGTVLVLVPVSVLVLVYARVLMLVLVLALLVVIMDLGSWAHQCQPFFSVPRHLDQCVMAWLYLRVTKNIFDYVFIVTGDFNVAS